MYFKLNTKILILIILIMPILSHRSSGKVINASRSRKYISWRIIKNVHKGTAFCSLQNPKLVNIKTHTIHMYFFFVFSFCWVRFSWPTSTLQYLALHPANNKLQLLFFGTIPELNKTMTRQSPNLSTQTYQ